MHHPVPQGHLLPGEESWILAPLIPQLACRIAAGVCGTLLILLRDESAGALCSQKPSSTNVRPQLLKFLDFSQNLLCVPKQNHFWWGKGWLWLFEYQICQDWWLPSGVNMGNPECSCSLSIPLPGPSITLPRKSSLQLHPTPISYAGGRGYHSRDAVLPHRGAVLSQDPALTLHPLLPITLQLLPTELSCLALAVLHQLSSLPQQKHQIQATLVIISSRKEFIWVWVRKIGDLPVTWSFVMPWFVYRDSPASQIPHSRHQRQFELQKGFREVGQKNTLWVCAKP